MWFFLLSCIRQISPMYLSFRCISRSTLSRYSRRQISLPSSWCTSSCWLYHDGRPYRILFLDERLQMEARYPLLRRHQPRFHRTHSDINSSQIMPRSHSTSAISTYGSSNSRLNSTFHHSDAGSSRVESSWNFHESRGDGKIRGGGKYSNHHHHHYHYYHRHRHPEHPWPTSHSENAREAPLPGAPFIAGLAEGRGRAWEEDGGQRRRWLGGRKSDCQYIP